MNDTELKIALNEELFQDFLCDRCGCHATRHGWWIEDGDVRCHNCVRGIAMAQAVFAEGRRRFALCFQGIYNLDDAKEAASRGKGVTHA